MFKKLKMLKIRARFLYYTLSVCNLYSDTEKLTRSNLAFWFGNKEDNGMGVPQEKLKARKKEVISWRLFLKWHRKNFQKVFCEIAWPILERRQDWSIKIDHILLFYDYMGFWQERSCRWRGFICLGHVEILTHNSDLCHSDMWFRSWAPRPPC